MTQRRTKRIQMLLAAILVLAAIVMHLVSQPRGKVVGNALRELTGEHTRVVWLQDLDDTADLSAHGREYRLMGFDSEDGLGERPILNLLESYARPLITPGGDRVLFSSRIDNQVYIVNWDGSEVRPLLWGFALDTWMDPADGVEWLYFGTGPRRVYDVALQKYSAVLRCPIDDPERVELVWYDSLLTLDSENNFQVSDDATHASLTYSGKCGVAELPNRKWTEYGHGSCPSVAGDGALWYLNDDQRSLSMFTSGPSSTQTVSVCDAPGVDGHMVVHPRSANDPHLFALAGPLTEPGEENDLEIYVGRFGDGLDRVDSWVAVSQNEWPDFAPDVWVELDKRVAIGRSDARRGLTWPVNAARAEFIHEGPVTGSEPIENLVEHCRKRNEFTLEAVVRPDESLGSEAGSIISFCTDSDECNFALGVEGGQYVLRLRTSKVPAGKAFPFAPVTPGKRQRITASYSPGRLVIYVDAKRVLITDSLRGTLGNWQDGQLVLGGGSWKGSVEGIGLYSRRHYGKEIALNNYLYGLRLRYQYFVQRARERNDS